MALGVAGAGDRRGRSVVSKAVALLDAFAVDEPELSLNELAGRTGLPLSTTYRLASELVSWGGLERVPGGGYRVGLRLLEVGALAPRSAGLHEIVVPFMQDLFVATGENVHLAVLEGGEALYVERVTGLRSIPVKSRRWGRMPLHATGVGKVLLAYADPEFTDRVIAAGLARFTPYTIVAPGHLRRNLAEVRRTGVAFAHEEMTVGRVSVAAPLFDAGDRAVAAMSIVVPTTVDPQRLAPALRTAALCASRRLRERAFHADPKRPAGEPRPAPPGTG
ncbi:IclR family transcriptional regulator [Actinoplanes sp. URMC 104]|uniref:IclR family transcriptional regulator n=1 Tax=Actinoplanes sp. URMC 104 TaxID=3423409 RepID=UPI003F1D68CF